jgi:Fe-S cluster assembly iron-binding protein IscA
MAVTLTEAAARHVTRYLGKRGKGVGVRLGVKTTGCSGLAYKLEYADELAPEDLVFEGTVSRCWSIRRACRTSTAPSLISCARG